MGIFNFKKSRSKNQETSPDGLNQSQFNAAKSPDGHLLVLAGAGTGKTKTIIARAKYLISKGVNPGQILILTFTRKASSEIVERVYSEINSDQKVIGSTFHGWCNSILLKYSKYFGYNNFTIIDRDDQESIFKLVSGGLGKKFKEAKIKIRKCIEIYSYGRNTKKNLTESISQVMFYKSIEDLDNNTKEKVESIRLILADLINGYQKKKKERNYIDYDDLIIIMGLKLSEDKKFLDSIGKKYSHILIDEMQDTNPIQWDILDNLKEVSNLFCVGDDAQSIYAFRGADFKNIHSFGDRVSNARILRLESNYRSTQEILDLSNWLLDKSDLNYDKKLHSVRGSGNKPFILTYNDSYKLANWIADDIERNYSDNNHSYFDTLVLSRASRASYFLQAVLSEREIPFMVFGGQRFMESAHIKDIVSFLRVINNISDEIAWVRFLTLWPGIGNVGAKKIIDQIFIAPTTDRVIEHLSIVKTSHDLSKLFEMGLELKNDPPQAIKRSVSEFEGVLKEKYSDYDKRKIDFSIFSDISKKFSTTSALITSLTIDNSESDIATLSMKDIIQDKNKSKDAVRLSTIHSAKGLEAKDVFIIDADPGNYPLVYNLGDPNKIEEDRRLLYVAMTRAKNNLFICRNHFHSNTAHTENYFLNEMPNELCDIITIQDGEKEQHSLDGSSNINDLDMDMDLS